MNQSEAVAVMERSRALWEAETGRDRGYTEADRRRFLKRFGTHKSGARRRGIPFLLTFSEWLDIWEESGHLAVRGRRRGQYAMARYGDKGPYAVGNVRIILAEENAAEMEPQYGPRGPYGRRMRQP